MRHPVLDQYIRLLVTQKRIVNNNLKAHIDLKSKIEELLEKLDDLIQIGIELKAEAINTDIRAEAEETLKNINIDIETAKLEKQTLDEKITAILST